MEKNEQEAVLSVIDKIIDKMEKLDEKVNEIIAYINNDRKKDIEYKRSNDEKVKKCLKLLGLRR